MIRTTLPSLFGISPRSDFMMDFSTSFIADLSHGWIISRRASGTVMAAIWFSGVGHAIVVHQHILDQARRSAPRSDARQLAFQRSDGLLHSGFGVEHNVIYVCHIAEPPQLFSG